jgi:hypothetical protein
MMDSSFLARLRGTLGNIISKSASGVLEENFSGRLPDEYVLHRDASGDLVAAQPGPPFASNQTYLQVVLNHMYVRQDRALWVEREHLGAVWMGLRYAGGVQSVPFVVGRDLLVDKVRNLPAGARIEFQDVRIGRMFPYTGGGLALYLGLWSTPTIDWATTIFSALDTIAGKIKVAGSLSQVLDMVDVLNQGISTVLGLNAIQAHLNLYQEFQDPGAGDIGVLRPGYFVMLNAPRTSIDPGALRVVDGRLCTVNDSGTPVAYYDHDFVLYSIVSQARLPTALDLFGAAYDTVLTSLIGSKSDPVRLAQAAQEYHALQTQVITSPDLTRDDKNRLIAYLNETLNSDAVNLAVNLKSAAVAFGPAGRPRLPAALRRPSPADFAAAIDRLDAAVLDRSPVAAAGAAAADFGRVLAAEQVRT